MRLVGHFPWLEFLAHKKTCSSYPQNFAFRSNCGDEVFVYVCMFIDEVWRVLEESCLWTILYVRDYVCSELIVVHPRGAGVPPFHLCSSLVHSLPHLLLFITFSFPFLIHFTYFLLLSIRSLSTRIVPLCFQAWGCRRRPNLGWVCFCVMIMLSVLLS